MLLGVEEELPIAHVGPTVGKRIGHAEAVAQVVDERAQLSHSNPKITSVAAQEAGLYELGPRDGRTAALGLRADDRLVSPQSGIAKRSSG